MDRPPTPHRPRPPNSPRDRSPLHSDEGCNVNLLHHPSESSVVLPVQSDIPISAVETSSWNTTAPTPTPPTSCPATFASFTTCSSPPPSAVPSTAWEWAQLVPEGGNIQLKDVKTVIKLMSEFAKTRPQHRLSPGVAEFVDRFRQRWLSSSVPPLPKVFPSSSSQPGLCEEPCTSAHAGQASSSKEQRPTLWARLFISELAETEDYHLSSELAKTEELIHQELLRWGIPLLPRLFPSPSSQPGPCEESCTSAHAGQASSSEDTVEAAPGVSCIPTTTDSRNLEEYESPTKRKQKDLR